MFFVPDGEQVDTADPKFPRASGYWWFGCKSASKGTLGNDRWNDRYPVDNSFGYGNLEEAGDYPPDRVNLSSDDDGDNGDENHDQVGDIILDAGTNSIGAEIGTKSICRD